MEDVPQYRTEAGDKLQREMDNLASLQECLSRSDNLTQNMLGILNSFELRLSKLEETITPIYQETGNLQRRHENIDKTLSELDHVIEFYHMADVVEKDIREGPSMGLENYLNNMEKLQKAMHYFTVNNPHSPEMSHVTSLYEAGKDLLEKEFKTILRDQSKPARPDAILDALAVEEESEEATSIEQLSEKVLSELKLISSWLLQCGVQTTYMEAYYTIRSDVLLKSLTALRDHLKSDSREGSSLGLTAPSPALSTKMKTRDTQSNMRASRRMAFVRKASSTLKRHISHLDTAGGGLTRQGGSSADLKDEIMDVDIDFYITSVSAFLKLIQSEAALMHGIVPERHQRRIFDQLIQSAFESIIKEGQQIAGHIKRATGRHQTTHVISLFPVLKHLRTIRPEFDMTLEGCRAPTRGKLTSLISSLDGTGAKALEEFIESIRNDPDKQSNMPKDGTVHELTSNTMLFLEQLLDFADTAGSMLLTIDPTSLPNVQNMDRPKLKLAEFITKVLSALGLNLNNKSSTYNEATIQAVFLLNNYNYILKSLRRSGMLDVVHMWNNEVEAFYDDQILNQKRIYSQRLRLFDLLHLKDSKMEQHYIQCVANHKQLYRNSWSWVISHISEDQKPVGGSQALTSETKLKDKEKQMIKDKFTGFNKEIEEITRIQKGFAIPDEELRNSLKLDNREYVIPIYRAFLKRYEGTNFTKNPEKYIKYNVRDVSESIERFFDSSA